MNVNFMLNYAKDNRLAGNKIVYDNINSVVFATDGSNFIYTAEKSDSFHAMEKSGKNLNEVTEEKTKQIKDYDFFGKIKKYFPESDFDEGFIFQWDKKVPFIASSLLSTEKNRFKDAIIFNPSAGLVQVLIRSGDEDEIIIEYGDFLQDCKSSQTVRLPLWVINKLVHESKKAPVLIRKNVKNPSVLITCNEYTSIAMSCK